MGTRVLTTAAKSLTTCYVQDSMRARKIPARVILVVQLSGDNGTPLTQGLSILTSVWFPGAMAVRHQKNLGYMPELARDLVGSRKPCVMILGSAPPSAPVATTTTITTMTMTTTITTMTTTMITITIMTTTTTMITILKLMITLSVMMIGVTTTSSDGPHSRRPRHLCVDPRVEMRGKKDGCRKWVA